MSLAVLIDRGLDLTIRRITERRSRCKRLARRVHTFGNALFSFQGICSEPVGVDGGEGTPVPIPNRAFFVSMGVPVAQGEFLLPRRSRWGRDGAGRFFRWGGAFLAAARSRSCDFWGSLAWPRDFSHSHGWGFFLAALRAVGVPSHSGVPSTCQFCIFRFQTD